MIARVLVVGDELLGGAVSDRNVAAIATVLGARGIPLRSVEIVGDEEDRIAEAVTRLAGCCDVLVITGGLGPTDDDLTREGVARALGVPVLDSELARGMVDARYEERGARPGGPSARAQSRLPQGCEPVTNPLGTAPGFRGTLGACRFWALPGVPTEVAGMVREAFRDLGELPEGYGWERFVATAGLSEVTVADKLKEQAFSPPEGTRLAFLPSPGGVRLRLVAPTGAPNDVLDSAEQAIRRVLGAAAVPRRTLIESLVARFAETGRTLATAESCTGGLIGAKVTDVPGSSSMYLGGIVCYSDRAKVDQLGVDPELIRRHGAVSEPVAREMALGALRMFGASAAVAVTGIAGPSGGTPEKPVGTVWIGLADGNGHEAARFRFPGNREMIRERTVQKALELAYRRGEGIGP